MTCLRSQRHVGQSWPRVLSQIKGIKLRSCPCMYKGSPGKPGFISLGVASRSLCYQMLGKEVFTHPFPLLPQPGLWDGGGVWPHL